MEIKTKEDWILGAEKIVPMLPEYVMLFKSIDEEMMSSELNNLIETENWNKLHERFNEIWFVLPDNPSIRIKPFSLLCDLCSEGWVLND